MRVVIVGPRDKKEEVYRKLVNAIIDKCKIDYHKLLIVTKSCDAGVGKIIRNRSLGPDVNYKNPEFDMLELSARHYLCTELPQSEFQANFDALNSALVEIGDEFHIIREGMLKGSMGNIITRIEEAGLPYASYGPNELHKGPKKCTVVHEELTRMPPLTPNLHNIP